ADRLHRRGPAGTVLRSAARLCLRRPAPTRGWAVPRAGKRGPSLPRKGPPARGGTAVGSTTQDTSGGRRGRRRKARTALRADPAADPRTGPAAGLRTDLGAGLRTGPAADPGTGPAAGRREGRRAARPDRGRRAAGACPG